MKRLQSFRSLALLLIVATGAGAFARRGHAQGPSDALNTVQATDTRTLLNGLTVEILSTRAVPQVALHLLIGAGSTLDPAGKAGLAELAAALLVESVPDWQGDPAEIGRVIEAGKTFRYEVGWDSTHFYAECTPQQVPTYLQAFSQLVRNPVMTEERFETVRQKVLDRLPLNGGAPQLAAAVFEAELFRGNPYARPLPGTAATLGNIVYGETVLFQRRYHLPNVSFMAIVGPVEAEPIRTLAGRVLGIWVMDDPFPFTFLPARGQTGLTLVALDAPEVKEPALIVGHLGLSRDAPDYTAADILARALDGRGSVAEARAAGAARSQATIDGRRLRGAVRLTAAGPQLNAAETVRFWRRQMVQLREEGPTAQETKQASESYLGALAQAASSAPSTARLMALAYTYRLGFNYYQRLAGELPGLRPADLRQAAQRVLDPDNLLAIYVGPVAGQQLDALKAEGWQLRIASLNAATTP